MSTVKATTSDELAFTRERGPAATLARAAWSQRRTKVGAVLVGLIFLIAFVGPYVTPHDPYQFVGPPFEAPSSRALLGTDYLGRDVLSQFLAGGRGILLVSAIATILGVGLGVAIGLTAAYSRPVVDNVLMRSLDVLLAFPAIILALVLVSTAGAGAGILILAVSLTNVPRVARVMRGAAAEVAHKDFVAAAAAMGLPRHRVVLGEILPNVTSTLVVELSLRFTYTIALIASLFFLGFAPDPGAADWGLMINTNRVGLSQQPYGVLLPVTAIALLTIGMSFVGDGLARASIGIERRTGQQ